jgi:NADP-dependent 3-hydroxy acid dehydrogenase YdfG
MPGLTRTNFAETRLRGDKSAAAEFYSQYAGTLEPDDIARAIVYAIEQPPHVTIAEMVVLPSS